MITSAGLAALVINREQIASESPWLQAYRHGRRDPRRDDLEAAPKGAIIIAYDWKTEIPGVFARHADDCPVRNGRPCTCGPLAYRASIREWETNRRMLSPDFPTAGEAKAWLRDQRASLEAAGRVALESGNLGAVVEELLHAAEKGRVADPNGGRYPPDELRELRGALSYVATELGGMNIEDILPSDVEHLVERLRDSGLSAGRVDSVVAGLHALFSFAIERDLVATDPVGDLTSQWAAPERTDNQSRSTTTRSASDAAIPEPGQPGVGAKRLSPRKRAVSWPAAPPPAPAPASSGERPGADGAGSEPATPPVRRASANRSRRPRSAGPTLDAVVRQFLRAADEGSIDRRPGEPYTPETLLDLRGSMSYVDDRLRAMAVREIRRRHVQKLVDDLRSVGLPASVVVTVVESLRALYAFAIQRNVVDFSPVVELSMPLDDDRAGDDAATWSHAPAPRPARPTAAPYSVTAPPYATTPPSYAAQPAPAQQAPAAAAPGQPPLHQQPAQPQPPYAPDWEFSGSRVRETLAPTTAMMALGGRVVSWTTRLALVAFVLLVLVLARELGLTSLIP